MNCSKPILALDLGVDKETGKKRIHIVPTGFRADLSIAELERKYGKDHVIKLPCGRCDQCKENKRIDWSIRCDMEGKMQPNSCFITLTYRDEVCPKWLSKGHIKRFLKKIRRNGFKYDKYFCCGEYGEKTNRPHYHLILFGIFPDDAQMVMNNKFTNEYAKTKSGYPVYESKKLENLWDKGFVMVNRFHQKEGFYVAGYVNKKTGHYDGFLMHSRNIGDDYMIENFMKLYEERLYIGSNGKVFSLPRRFKQVMEKLGYSYSEREEDKVRMRKLELSEMVQRKLTYREQLLGYGDKKMQDRLEKRSSRL